MRDWQGLARKVATGKPLEQAAVEMGIPLEEVLTHAREQMTHGDALPWQMQLVGQNALAKGIEVLTEIAEEGVRCGEFERDTDLQAARELARLGIAAIKMAAPASRGKAGKGGTDAPRDLFDVRGPWDLKSPGN